MSHPRRALGPNLPGRLAATQLRVLAAEMSDPGRLARGRGYWAEGAVTDISVDPGVVTATVQGSRRQPYLVSIAASSGPGMPTRRELDVSCTCPDDDGSGRSACKHVVAALFQFGEEVAIEPDLIGHWRQRHLVVNQAHPPASDVPELVSTPPPPPPHVVAFDALLRAPCDASLPDLPHVSQLVHPSTGSTPVDDMLADALSWCALWRE